MKTRTWTREASTRCDVSIVGLNFCRRLGTIIITKINDNYFNSNFLVKKHHFKYCELFLSSFLDYNIRGIESKINSKNHFNTNEKVFENINTDKKTSLSPFPLKYLLTIWTRMFLIVEGCVSDENHFQIPS